MEPLVKPLACHIHTNINTFQPFFIQISGCFTRGAFTKVLRASLKPFARGAFIRRAFARLRGILQKPYRLCKSPLLEGLSLERASAKALVKLTVKPLAWHLHTHMHILVFFLQIWGCFTGGVFTIGAFTKPLEPLQKP